MIKILWLGDDYFRLQDLKTILEISGYGIIFCQNIETAISVVNNTKDISLFILDMMLPPTGLEINKIRETDYGMNSGYIFYDQYLREDIGNTPVIFLSAARGVYEKFKTNRQDENITFLRKPIDSENLIQIIEDRIKPAANSGHI